jgi:hypothetical protein
MAFILNIEMEYETGQELEESFTNSCGSTGGSYAPPASCRAFAGVHGIVSPLAAAAGMGSEVHGSERSGSETAHRRDEPASVERLLSRPDRSS